MSLTSDLVSYILRSEYEDLPKQVIEVTKRNVLDALAVIIAGSSADGVEPMVKLVKGWGGRAESTILIHGGKVPAPNAALVNCTMARARDFDPAHDVIPVHAHATIVPSALIIAEYSKMFKSKVINGKDFISAVTLGADLHYRLRLAGGKANLRKGWVTNTYAPIVVATMGGKMLGFDEAKMLNAMGIAYAQCSGNQQSNFEGSLMTRTQQGFGGKAGILAIILADEGFTGANDMLEGKYGFYSVYMQRDGCKLEELTAGLGERFEESAVCTKFYPCCHMTHGAIYGVLELAKEHNIKADDIEKVTISTSLYSYNVCGIEEEKVAPRIVPDAQFSYYYTTATALVKGRVSIEHFTEEAIRDAEVLAMARRIKVVTDPEKDKLQATICPTDIDIETKYGKHYKTRMEFFKGHAKNPLTMDEVAQKMRDCARFSFKPLSSRNIDEIVQMVNDLDLLNDVTAIPELLG